MAITSNKPAQTLKNEIYEELTYFNNEDIGIIEDDIENDYIEMDDDIQGFSIKSEAEPTGEA
ncbi:hypothetical protein C2G38_2216547 [Gigaspora rosea]|uniref:Uncharacterized protein n=1 Tax=Gigaspora rosea TaxID=44941 RepID=A0A397UH46_9GLOM|nr:hypothetical protein C2G38_2216547 [Gigaspora rosea]